MKIYVNELKSVRQKQGFKQSELAISGNVSTVTYQRYESGEREPLVSTAVALADALQVKTYEEFKDLFGIPQRQLGEISTNKIKHKKCITKCSGSK